MSKYTPGPWESNKSESFGNTVFYVSQQDGAPYTQHYSDVASTIPGELESIQEANANLIAASPEMLEALKEAVACGMVPASSAKEGGAARHARQTVVADMIRAAIAKAEGESND